MEFDELSRAMFEKVAKFASFGYKIVSNDGYNVLMAKTENRDYDEYVCMIPHLDGNITVYKYRSVKEAI